MKLRVGFLCLLSTCLAAIPVLAQDVLYDNGPINRTVDAWSVSSGFAVSDTFTIGGGGASVTGMSFGAWLFPGDQIHFGELSITSSELAAPRTSTA